MARLKPGAMLLHSAAVAVMTRAWFHLDKLPNNAWLEKEVGGHLQLLTIQGYVHMSYRILWFMTLTCSGLMGCHGDRLLAAWATMSLSLLVDVVPSRSEYIKTKSNEEQGIIGLTFTGHLIALTKIKRALFMIAMPVSPYTQPST